MLIVMSSACERYDVARDESLKKSVTEMRSAMARFRRETGRHPRSLAELTPKYLPQIPTDPFTHSATTWRVTTEESVQPSTDFQTATVPAPQAVIIDVHSTATGADRSGMLYSNY